MHGYKSRHPAPPRVQSDFLLCVEWYYGQSHITTAQEVPNAIQRPLLISRTLAAPSPGSVVETGCPSLTSNELLTLTELFCMPRGKLIHVTSLQLSQGNDCLSVLNHAQRNS